jgi:type III secretion system chaperone SycN
MDWVSDTVTAFGQSMGIPGLALDPDGYVLFTLENGGILCVQDLQPEGGQDVLITVAQPLPAPPAASMRKALRLADFRASPLSQIQLALRGEDLVVTLRMPRHSFVLSALEDAVEALFDFHTRVAQLH